MQRSTCESVRVCLAFCISIPICMYVQYAFVVIFLGFSLFQFCVSKCLFLVMCFSVY